MNEGARLGAFIHSSYIDSSKPLGRVTGFGNPT